MTRKGIGLLIRVLIAETDGDGPSWIDLVLRVEGNRVMTGLIRRVHG
jgi:hypothetical protein